MHLAFELLGQADAQEVERRVGTGRRCHVRPGEGNQVDAQPECARQGAVEGVHRLLHQAAKAIGVLAFDVDRHDADNVLPLAGRFGHPSVLRSQLDHDSEVLMS